SPFAAAKSRELARSWSTTHVCRGSGGDGHAAFDTRMTEVMQVRIPRSGLDSDARHRRGKLLADRPTHYVPRGDRLLDRITGESAASVAGILGEQLDDRQQRGLLLDVGATAAEVGEMPGGTVVEQLPLGHDGIAAESGEIARRVVVVALADQLQ